MIATWARKFGLVLAAVILMVFAKTYFEARAAFQEAQVFLQKGAWEEAVFALDRSVQWYFPGTPFGEPALKQLWQISEERQVQDRNLALLALDTMRGSIFAVRSFYQPYASFLPKVDTQIARLRAQEQVDTEGGEGEEAYRFHESVLKRDFAPNPFGSFAIVFGFFVWIGGVFLFIWKALTPQGRVQSAKVALLYGALSFFGFSVWFGGLFWA